MLLIKFQVIITCGVSITVRWRLTSAPSVAHRYGLLTLPPFLAATSASTAGSVRTLASITIGEATLARV